MEQVNLFIIDRSQSYCNQLKSILTKDKDYHVMKTTTDMTEAKDYLTAAAPDIILLDIMMPDEHDQSALQGILAMKAVPVIILAEPSVDQTARTVSAMANGAVDFIRKVHFENTVQQQAYEADILAKIANVTNANRSRSIAKQIKANPILDHVQPETQSVKVIPQTMAAPKENIIVIGTSTGGPRALHKIMQQIPKDFKESILIVQHMPSGFTKSLAARLNNIGNICVKEASNGERIKKSVVYIAPGNFHMRVKRKQDHLVIHLSQDENHLPHRPSVDILFNSVAKLEDYHKIAVVLTGMGKDGRQGVIDIKTAEKDAVIIAESKETSVIDGMPRAVIETNLVTDIMRIEKIGTAIVNYTKKRGN